MFDLLHSLVVQLVLHAEGLPVVALQVLLPPVIHGVREHELHLRDLSQVVLLVSYDAHDVLVSAFTEGEMGLRLAWLEGTFLLLPELLIQLHKFTVTRILRFLKRLSNLHFAKRPKDTRRVVELMRLPLEGLERGKITLAPLTDHHRVPQRELLAPLMVLVNHGSLPGDALLEIHKQLSHFLIIEVNLSLDLLHVDTL